MNVQEIDFMSDLHAAEYMKPRRASILFLFSILAFVVLFIVWAALSHVEILVRAEGQIVPSSDVQVVQSLDGGVLKELLVAEGERVKKGQVLARLSDVDPTSQQGGAQAEEYGLRAKRARLEAEAGGKDFVVPDDIVKNAPQIASNEKALYLSRQQELKNAVGMLDQKIASASAQISETNAQINRLVGSAGLLQQELAITRKMVAQQAVPKIEALKQERELSDTQGQLQASREKIIGLQADLKSAQQERRDQDDKFRSQSLGELNSVETQISKLKENLKSLGDRVSRSELRSPVDGIVNRIAVKTIGGVVQPAQQLVEIVPIDNQLKIIARVLPNDIAFLKEGQDVNVKITAYDAQRYGMLKGKLVRIGANSVQDHEGHIFFEIEVHTDTNYLGSADHPLPVTPGMVAEVDVVTGKRTVLDYLAQPVLRTKSRALTEI